jgi:arabinose-5-phosphate isomerase
VALLDARGFSPDDFARSHPRGRLPRQALVRVSDVMRKPDAMPVVQEQASLKEALIEMTRARMGMTAVVDAAGRVRGIFTDGDLRRTLEKTVDIGSARVSEVMTPAPKTIAPDALAAEAVQRMEAHKINQMLVVDEHGALVGALNMHDLFRAKVI